MQKKKLCAFALAFVMLWSMACVCLAEIQPPEGPGQIGYAAVVLCDSLTVRKDRSASSQAVKNLRYGDRIVIQDNWDGWANCFVSENEGPIGWVKSDYLVIDPAWYICDEATPVYAWNDHMALKVALLDRGTQLPILKDEGNWLLVSLRGAAGWIYKTAQDLTSADTKSSISSLSDLTKAELVTPKGSYLLTDEAGLEWIEENFSIAQPIMSAGCPFDAVLILYCADGTEETLYMATDGCRNFRTPDGSYFSFGDGEAALKQYDSTSIIAENFWKLFGISMPLDIY